MSDDEYDLGWPNLDEVTVTSARDLLYSSWIRPFYFPEKQVMRREPDPVRVFLGKEKSTAQRICDDFSHMVDAVVHMNGWRIDTRRGGKEDSARLRSAMAAMSNVMNNVLLLADDDYPDRLLELGERWQREEMGVHWGIDGDRIKADASAAWSHAVRAGVAALPKPGPVVACQGDYDDE